MNEEKKHWDQLHLDFEAEDIKAILETLLFISSEPIPLQRLHEAIGRFYNDEEIRDVLQQLSREYDSRSGGLQIVELAGGYRMSTRPQYDHIIRRFKQEKRKIRLTQPALETLAIIAYKQPVTTPEIEAIRGVNVSSIIRNLLEKRLIKMIGRRKVAGNPLVYGTTQDFLEYFGLKDLESLPSMEEFFESFEE